ncbi:uncharacterized protein LOC116136180 isoform X2 [Pistacia vera]|uniref:uncharacterized protein LOC116136180 isoform X2 n=1 Tax=Pistacia vera TaxID=55513 RepID=UPI00126359B6|nr:uncharacterized protein LOC116136180 isoform X2 [Pistacia vera]
MASLVAFMGRKLEIEIIRLLKKKRIDPEFSAPDEINELDIFKLDPSELPRLSKINSDEQAWPFFSEPYKNVKGKQAHLTNGNWEKTGNDREVRDKSTGKRIGGKKNYVYYKRGGSPKQKIKTDWVMHEYYVDDDDPRYKKDFVFRYVEKNPTGKPNTSTPDDGQPSHRLASDAETYAEKTSTEVESQQPSTHCLGNEFLEVESELQSNHSLVSDTGNYFATNTSTLEEPRLLSNQNLGFDTRNYEFADNTSSMEVEPGLLSNHNLFHDPFAPITSSMVQPQLLSNRDMEFDLRNHFVPNTSMLLPHQNLDSLMVGPQLPSNHNMVFDLMNHSTPCTSSMVGPQLLSNQNMAFDPINHFASITSSMQVESQLLSNQNLVFDPMNNSTPCTSSMLGPQLLSNQNMVFDPINHYASITSSMQVESQLLSNQNLVFDPMNNFAPCTSSMVQPQLLSNHNMELDPRNHFAPITSSMVQPQLLSNQNLVSDYSRNHFVPNASSMVAHDQLLSNHNFFSDPRNHFAPNTCLMVHPQQVAELFAQFTALFGRYLLNHSSVSTPPWPTNPQQGSYSSLYSNGAFGNNCTSSSSQFHGGLEDARIAQRNFQDKHPEEVTGQDSSY